ncbi:hypothetical protein VMF7928_00714 [Vibrio marisflavi CECT 7928]|uniref:Chitin-binding type-3 domain-containing protein n=1 Tax=Vibrio marisflavi CECT 7928 TaxID=634439 RepID=A0ABN8E1X1_9VIBR|nr:hypothetical protein VMF7928_00714 [Vibrio marisflavi CECT 7928]
MKYLLTIISLLLIAITSVYSHADGKQQNLYLGCYANGSLQPAGSQVHINGRYYTCTKDATAGYPASGSKYKWVLIRKTYGNKAP